MISNEISQKVKTATDDDVVVLARDKTTTVKVIAISEIAVRGAKTEKMKAALFAARQDKRSFWNQYLVCDFADAALAITGIKPYEGDKESVKRLISSELRIWQ